MANETPKTPPKAPRPKVDAEAQRIKKEEQSRAVRRRNRQFIGFALAILIIVGAVSIVLGGVNLVRNMLDTSGLNEEYQKRFEPFVWFNVLPFDSVTVVDENIIKQVCLWGVLNSTADADVQRNERGEALIPSIEVDRYGVQVFGPDFRFSGHDGFRNEEWDLDYGYDAETQQYTMPSTGLDPQYLASVVDVVRESGGVRRVVMGYVSTRTSDNQVVQTPDYANPTVYMDFMLRRDGNSYYLYAIQANTTHVGTGQPASVAQSFPDYSFPDYSVPDYVPPVTPGSGAASGTDSSLAGGGDDSGADGGEDSQADGDDAA